MTRTATAALLAALLLAGPGCLPEPEPRPPAPQPPVVDAGPAAEVNRLRVAAGLAPAPADPRLARMAADWSAAMAAEGGVAHAFRGRPGFAARLAASGYPGPGGEVAARAPSAAAAGGLWLGSAPHRRIILRPDARAIGGGQTEGYWCVVIGY